MNLTVFIMTTVMVITFFSPFGVWYGVKIAKKSNYPSHRKIQNIIFLICVVGVLALEGLIRSGGGSGSLAAESNYYGTGIFTFTLASHIIIAVLSYLFWTVLVILSNIKYQNTLPGKLSNMHKKLGYAIFGGLVYTAASALAIYLMTLNLV